jgi:hypothetical protein
MQTPAVLIGPDVWVGLSWFIRDVGGMRIVSHDGGTNGQIAKLVLVPSEQFALAVLTNADSGSQLTGEVEKLGLASLLGIDEPEPVPQERSMAELAAYASQYGLSTGGVIVSVHNGYLSLERISGEQSPDPDSERTRQPARAAFYEEDRIVVLDGPMKGARAEFLRDPDGTVGWFRQYRAYRRQGSVHP